MGFGMKKKTLLGTSLSIIVTLVLLLAFGGMTVFADDLPYGECGTDLYWRMDNSGHLYISGEGDMDDYQAGGAPWYAYRDDILAVTIENGVTGIGDYAFNNCENITQVNISNDVSSIGVYAFANCRGLTSVSIPSGVTIIKYDTFLGCANLERVVLPDGLETIGYEAFKFCSKLYDISIPANVNSIGQYAFESCQSIESITVPSRVTTIDISTFAGCSKLNTVILPNNLTHIAASAFSGCASLKSIELPENLTRIGRDAFAGSGLESIEIPRKVEEVEPYAFADCQNLKSITIANGVRRIREYAFYQSGITSLVVPATVGYIEQYTFMDCKQLTSVVIRDGVDGIFEYAFMGCSSLTTVTIPESVRYIYTDAFKGCTSLTDVYCDVNPTGEFKWYDNNCDDFMPLRGTRCHVKDEYLDYFKANFMTGPSFAVNVTFVGQTVDMGLGDHLYGYTVSLDGDIGVNFHMKLSDELLASDTAKMVFTITSLDGSNTRTQEVYVSSLNTIIGNDCTFKCSVVAKEMTSTITAQMVDGDQTGKVYIYSVQEYAQYLLAHPSNYSAKVSIFVKAMLNYGARAQIYFNYNTDNLANSILPENEQNIPVVLDSDINVERLQTTGSIKPSKVSLSLESTVTLRLSFKTADVTGVTFTDDKGNTLTTEISGDYTVVLIKGIPVQDLNNSVTITASDGSTISYCPLRYCRAVLANTDNPEITPELRELVAALYLFNDSINYGI